MRVSRRHAVAVVVILALSWCPLKVGAGTLQQGSQQQEAEQEEQTARRVDEVVVVTASRTEQLLLEAPASISVLDASEIALSPTSFNYADLLRSTPGLNVTEMAAGDVTMQARANAGVSAAGQLTLVDGRSVYLDFLNITIWRWMPMDFAEIERVEVQRGPGSAVWGGNAFLGVTNIVTKSPRTMGSGLRLRVGGGERRTGFGSFTYVGSNDRVAGRFSGGYFTQDPWDRPAPLPNGTPRDLFSNPRVSSPRLDGRIDLDVGGTSRWSFAGGFVAGGGLLHTSIGPFSISSDSGFGYARIDHDRGALNVRAYANFVDIDSTNLLLGLPNRVVSNTYDLSATNTSPLGSATLTYGVSGRLLDFDVEIAPSETRRTEFGGFAQVVYDVSDHLALHAGGRVDDYSNLSKPVFSPRAAVLIRPGATNNHVVRVGYGRSFLVASLIHNYLDTTFFTPLQFPGGVSYLLPTRAVGNPDLAQVVLDQIEVGYHGMAERGRWSWDVVAFWGWQKDARLFQPVEAYTSANPPPGWPLPPQVLIPDGPVVLPSVFSYTSGLGLSNSGVEVGVRLEPVQRNAVHLRYTFQTDYEIDGAPPDSFNTGPEHRFNVAWNGWRNQLFYSASYSYVAETYWTDVLDERFWGTIPSYSLIDATIGYMFGNGLGEVSLRGTNLANRDTLQHIFGDIIRRRIVAEISLTIR